MKINWKKNIFSSTYQLSSNHESVGELKEKVFSNSTKAELFGVKIKFSKSDFFSSEVKIIDRTLNQEIGKIKFNAWGNKAVISLNGAKFQWQYEKFWASKWQIARNGIVVCRYKSKTSRGSIESTVKDEALILTGLFIYNHYLKITMMVVMFIVLFAST